MSLIKLFIILAVLLLLSLPFLPLRTPFSLCFYNFPPEKRPKNLVFLGGAVLLSLAVVIFLPKLLNLINWFLGLKYVKLVIEMFPSFVSYDVVLLRAIIANIVFCLAVLILFAILAGFSGLKAAVKDNQREKKAERKKRREEKRKKERAERTNRSKREKNLKEEEKTEHQGKKDPLTEPPVVLPEILRPEPEERDESAKIRIPGETTRGIKQPQGKEQEPPMEGDEGKGERGISLPELAEQALGLFYEKSGEEWVARPQSYKVAKHLRNFLVVIGVVYLLVFALLMIPALFSVNSTWLYRVMERFAADCYLYPAVSMVVLVEVFWFLNGMEKELEPEEAAEPWSRQQGRIVDLDEVEKKLIRLHGQNREVGIFYSDDVENPQAGQGEPEVEKDPLLKNIAEFVKSQGYVRNDTYLAGIQALQAGKDALFTAPLYSSVGVYLYAYLNVRIAMGERIVVICQREEEMDAVIENLNQGLQRALQVHRPLWSIAKRSGLKQDALVDLLVLTPKDFCDEQLYLDGRRFFSRVTMALLPDADRVIRANNYYCLLTSERLRQAAGRRVQYLFLATRNTLNLDNSLYQYFNLEEPIVRMQDYYSYGNVRLYVWKTGNDGTVLLDNGAQNVLLEVSVSNVAARMGVPNINVVSQGAIFPDQVNAQWLDVYDAQERPMGFVIVSDDGYNLPGVIFAYSRYIGKKVSVLHIISRPYLLRDYFFEQSPRYFYEQPLMEQSIAEHAQVRKSEMVLLLCRLMRGMELEQFAAAMERMTGGTMESDPRTGEPIPGSVQTLVKRCISEALGYEPEGVSFFLTNRSGERFRPVRILTVRDTAALDALLASTELVRVHFTGQRKTAYLDLFRCMLGQRYMLGQNLVYDHRNYEIKYIDYQRGILEVDDANVVHGIPRDYIQIRSYTIPEDSGLPALCQKCPEENGGALPPGVEMTCLHYHSTQQLLQSLTMVRVSSSYSVQSDTEGYYMMRSDLESLDLTGNAVTERKLDGAMRAKLHRDVQQVLYLALDGEFGRSDRKTMTLAVLLQEMMKTIFPNQYFCISVCPILAKPGDIYENDDHLCSQIAGMYPRLKNWGKVREHSIELLIVDDCQGGTGVLDLLYDQEGTFLSNVLGMLCDYLDWQRTHEPGTYFYFGAKMEPEIYDLVGLRQVLQPFMRRYIREHDLFTELADQNCCGFCGESLQGGESYLWQNRLNICGRCQGEYCPDQGEWGEILKYILDLLKRSFQADMPHDIKVEQVPAGAFRDGTVSELDVGAHTIRLAQELPLTAAHVALLQNVVRLWQLEELSINGDPELEGQVQYVTLQYLEELEQHQRRRRLYRRLMVQKSGEGEGFRSLNREMQVLSSHNSFAYMLGRLKKSSGQPVPKKEKGISTRKGNPAEVCHYYYSKMSGPEQEAYDRLLQGRLNMEERISLEGLSQPVKVEQLDWLITCICNDHPEIFWDNGRYVYAYDGDVVKTVKMVYTMTPQERDRRQAEIDQVYPALLQGITEETDDFTAAQQIYERMIDLMDYDTIALERQKRLKELDQNLPDDLRSIYGGLVGRRGVCAGYARSYQFLLQKLGFTCIYVTGEVEEAGHHAWNIVQMEGEYYHVDVTWGDGSDTNQTVRDLRRSYSYLGLTDSDIRRTRDIDPVPKPPACDTTACNYFVRNGLFFPLFDFKQMKEHVVEFLKGNEAVQSVQMRFPNARVMDMAMNHMLNHGGFKECLEAAGITVTRIYARKDDKLCVLTMWDEAWNP